MRWIMLPVAALLLAACSDDSSPGAALPPTSDEPAADGFESAFGAEAAGSPGTWLAMSRTAEAFTGDITIVPLQSTGPGDMPSLRIAAENGLTYETELIPGGGVEADMDWMTILPLTAEAMTSPDGPPVEVHAVASEVAPPGAKNGGLCDRTFALAISRPVRQADGAEVIGIAAFSGDQWPPVSGTALCGTFNYFRSPEAQQAN